MNLSLPLGSPSGGAAEKSEAEGVSYRPKGLGWAIIDALYHPTNDTPSDLASSATSLKEEGEAPPLLHSIPERKESI